MKSFQKRGVAIVVLILAIVASSAWGLHKAPAITTLNEVVNIQREGAQKRKEAEVELGRIEGELKQKLMELRS